MLDLPPDDRTDSSGGSDASSERALAVRWRERSRRPLALHYHGVMVYPYAKIPPPGGLRLQNVKNSKS